MPRLRRYTVIFLGLQIGSMMILATSLLATDEAPDRVWPMPGRRGISSNFCEYREGHFHAGLDIRTFGREGIECRASDDGYISRIRASASGYGKAIYLQLYSGETIVYAHLSEFAPDLEAALRSEQTRRNHYKVDFRFPRDRFAVKRGDVVGYSGSTGTSAPHLHFEVRNEQEHPMDPFAHGFSMPDDLRPAFEAVMFMPLAKDSGPPFEVLVHDTGGGRYEICEVVELQGPMGIAVQAIDYLNSDSGRLAPQLITVDVDGERIASIALDTFSFGHTAQVDFLYEMAAVRLRKDYFIQTFERAGESMWNREFVDGGRITPRLGGDKIHQASVIVMDRAGNFAELVFEFRDLSGTSVVPTNTGECVRPSWDTETNGNFYWFEDIAYRLSSPHAGVTRAQEAALQSRGIDGPAFTAADLTAVPLEMPFAERGDNLNMYLVGIMANATTTISFAELDLELLFGMRTLYADAVVYAREWPGQRDRAQDGELVPRSRAIQIGPYSWSLRADMEIRFIVDQPDTFTAIYRLNERKGDWTHYASILSGAGVTTAAKRPGVYAVLDDRYGPSIRRPFFSATRSYVSGRERQELVVPIEDAGSGVDHERCEVYFGESRRIARWDGNQKKMFIEIGDDNILSSQAVRIVAYDKQGNRSEQQFRLSD